MFKHVLVPTDGSALSDAAIQLAVAFASETGAKLTGIHVMPEFSVLAYGPEMVTDTEERFLKVARERAEEYLAAMMKAATVAGVECETVATTKAHPYEAIINVATQKHCDLIIMASHGRRGVRALLLGSETQKVLTHSHVPVLVVRPPTPAHTSHGAQTGKSSARSSSSQSQLP